MVEVDKSEEITIDRGWVDLRQVFSSARASNQPNRLHLHGDPAPDGEPGGRGERHGGAPELTLGHTAPQRRDLEELPRRGGWSSCASSG
jgi:hypothetical protein